MKKLENDERYLAWLAGFFDGDGCVSIKKDYALVVAFCGKFLDETFEEIQRGFGGHITPIDENTAQWQLGADEALKLLKAIRPYSKDKKKEIDIGIEFQRNKLRMNRWTPEHIKRSELQRRERLRRELSRLNQVRKLGKRVE